MIMGVVLADRALAAADARPLQLEVYVNDTDARLIGTFTQLADRRIVHLSISRNARDHDRIKAQRDRASSSGECRPGLAVSLP